MNNRNQIYSGNQIDFIELFIKILSKWYFCLMALIIGAGSGFLYASLTITPVYQSSAMVYLRGESTSSALASLGFTSYSTPDYLVLLKSRPNLEKTVADLGLEMSTDALSGMISIANIENTHILKITVNASSPQLAKDIANCFMENSLDEIREISSQEPYVVEKAIENGSPINNSKRKYTMMGGLAGVAIVAGIIALLFILNDSIKSSDEIEKYLDIPVLAVVVEDDSLDFSSKTKKKRKKTKKRIFKVK